HVRAARPDRPEPEPDPANLREDVPAGLIRRVHSEGREEEGKDGDRSELDPLRTHRTLHSPPLLKTLAPPSRFIGAKQSRGGYKKCLEQGPGLHRGEETRGVVHQKPNNNAPIATGRGEGTWSGRLGRSFSHSSS